MRCSDRSGARRCGRWEKLWPAFVDTYTPLPQYALRELLPSPVPTYTTFGFDCETATAPIEITGWLSKIGTNVRPLFSVFHSPPDAVAA
jgi:hypothetical protein